VNPSSARSQDLAIVIPLANEERTIDELLRRVLAQLSPQDKVYCVLDRVSKDGTRSRVEAAGQADPRVLCVYSPENRCVVDAYFRGYREALAGGHDWVLEMDGGLSHQPEEIPRFIAAMSIGHDFAAGSRFVKGGRYVGLSKRHVISRGGTVLANAVLGSQMRDMTSGFECFTHEALSYVVERGVRSRAHFFQTEIRYMLHAWRWVEVPITYRSPSSTVGGDSLGEALRNLSRMRRESRAGKLSVR
jgi:dolichol-phosphate mannosyltransferase